MTTAPYSYRLFARSDYSAFWALFTDNLVNLMVLSGVCQFVFQMPAEIVYGRNLKIAHIRHRPPTMSGPSGIAATWKGAPSPTRSIEIDISE